MARMIRLLTPAWVSDCNPLEERSNWVSLAAMAATMVVSANPAFTIFTTSAFDREFFCGAPRAATLRAIAAKTRTRVRVDLFQWHAQPPLKPFEMRTGKKRPGMKLDEIGAVGRG